MLALKTFRTKAYGVPDLLNWAALIESGVVQGKDGSLMAGYFFSGRDIESSTDNERNTIANHVNKALARLGAGWSTWGDATRLSASSYPDPELSHFPDPISRLVDTERRVRFEAEGVHFESEYAIILQFTPPLRRKSRLADMVYDDDQADTISHASRILARFQKDLEAFEDTIGDVLVLHRMASYLFTNSHGTECLRDELVNYLHFTLTGSTVALNIPPAGAYLDAVVGGQDLWAGDTPKIGDKFIGVVGIEGFPAESLPGILDSLDHFAIPYRWSSRMIYMDRHEVMTELHRFRRKWKQQVRGFLSQVFKTTGGVVNEDALLMAQEAEASITEASSGYVAFGYYTSVIVLMERDRQVLQENARLVVREIERCGFAARIETVNTMEAWLGSLPGHVVPNVRRPIQHTEHLSHMLPLASVWTGFAEHPCPAPMYPPHSPPLLYAATTGATPMRLNLHSADVGHTLIFGPIGAGKTTLLATVAIQALRYEDVMIWSFDYKRGMLATIKACGGRHYDIAGEQGRLAFCPLSELNTLDDLVWAEDWIGTCFELQMNGAKPSPEQRESIHRAMLLLQSDAAPGARTLTHFIAMVQDNAIRSALRYYTVTGALGGILDANEDNIAYERLMAFEMEDLLTYKAEGAIPVLLYLFRRFEKALKGKPTYLILDEASFVLAHPVFSAKLATWLRILRSKNCAVIMATQSLSDAHKSGILDVLLESCPTRIFLPNPEAETTGSSGTAGPKNYYQDMGLSDKQISIIKHAVRKREYYLVQPEGRRKFELNLGPIGLSFSGATSEGVVKEIIELERVYGDQWPYRWMDQNGVDYQSLLDDDKSGRVLCSQEVES